MTDWTDRLAIVSDEIDDSFAEAARLGRSLGIRAYELRALAGRRFPDVTERALQEVADTAADLDLELIGVSPGFFKGPLDAADIAETFETRLPTAFRLMQRLEIRRMTLFSFRRESRSEAIPAAIYDHLGRAIDLCAREGIEVLLENVSSIYADTGANLATIARTLGVKVAWDPANAAASGETAYPAGYDAARDLIAHVHFKNWTAEAGWVAINDGVVDLAGQVAGLKAANYGGYYCLEPHQWQDRRKSARQNAAQLLSLLRAK
ncbi:MAG: TIM barrel protein [Chloroflexota bacterium]|nr:TIM barrel protein [Chloroflexota bacterium]